MSEAIANLMNVPFRCREVSCLFIMRIRPPLQAHDSEAAAGVRVFRRLLSALPKGGVSALFPCAAFREKAKRPFRVCDWPLFFRASFREGVERLLFARDIPFAHERVVVEAIHNAIELSIDLGQVLRLVFTGLPAM